MRDVIEAAIKGHCADYIEIRVEESESTGIRYRGKELEEIGKSTSMGGNVRALVKGGWGFVCFNDFSSLQDKVEMAVRQASLVNGEAFGLAPVEVITDVVPAFLRKDPLSISLTDKQHLLDQYADIMLSVPGVVSANINYGDSNRRICFGNSEGSYVEQGKVDVVMRLSAVAREGGEVQQSGESLGELGDFSFAEQLHDKAKAIAQRAVELLEAPQVKGGEYPVVLDPVLAGVFIHEAFGHLSEADHIYEDKRMRELMTLGRHFGGKHLNVVDGAAVPGLRGSYKYDDEGVPSQRNYLIREGKLVGRLHSRETASKMGEKPSGNARAINHRFSPIVRMTNTFIEPGENTFNDLIADISEGVYARNWYGGMTNMEMFTFSAGEAFMIRNGKIEELLRPVMLSGNLFTTLNNLDAVGNDLDMNQGGGCGKAGQSPLPVSNGSPHIRIQKCLVGGS